MPPEIAEGAAKLGYLSRQLIEHFVSPCDESTGRQTRIGHGGPPV